MLPIIVRQMAFGLIDWKKCFTWMVLRNIFTNTINTNCVIPPDYLEAHQFNLVLTIISCRVFSHIICGQWLPEHKHTHTRISGLKTDATKFVQIGFDLRGHIRCVQWLLHLEAGDCQGAAGELREEEATRMKSSKQTIFLVGVGLITTSVLMCFSYLKNEYQSYKLIKIEQEVKSKKCWKLLFLFSK